MAALSADVHIPRLGGPVTKIAIKAVGADTFYAGALVFADGTNGKAQAVPAATDSFLGICVKQVVAAAADDLVEIYIDGVWALQFAGAAEVDVGTGVFVDIGGGALTDNETDLVSGADATPVAGDILIGKCIGLAGFDSSRGWVQLHTGDSVVNVLGVV